MLVPFLIKVLTLLIIFAVCYGIYYFGSKLASTAPEPFRWPAVFAVCLVAFIVFLVAALPLIGVSLV